jgi:hypothetical protein
MMGLQCLGNHISILFIKFKTISLKLKKISQIGLLKN